MKKTINDQILLFGLPISFNDEVKLYQPTLKEIFEEDLTFEEIIAPFIMMDKDNFDEDNDKIEDFDYYFIQIVLGYLNAISDTKEPMGLDEWIKSPQGNGLVIVRLIRVLRFLFKTDDIAINISEDPANGLNDNFITINKSYKIDRNTYYFLKEAVCDIFDTEIKINKEERVKSEEELYWEQIFEERRKEFEKLHGKKKEKNKDKINIFTLINYILHNKNSQYDYNSIQNLTIYQIKNTFKYYQSQEMYDVDMMYRTSGQFKIDSKGEHWFFDKR